MMSHHITDMCPCGSRTKIQSKRTEPVIFAPEEEVKCHDSELRHVILLTSLDYLVDDKYLSSLDTIKHV
jgi:hypothetical protein